jgi:hypothetical protein
VNWHDALTFAEGFLVAICLLSMAQNIPRIINALKRRHRVSGASGGQSTVVECTLPPGTTSIIVESRGAGGWGSEDAKPKETKK